MNFIRTVNPTVRLINAEKRAEAAEAKVRQLEIEIKKLRAVKPAKAKPTKAAVITGGLDAPAPQRLAPDKPAPKPETTSMTGSMTGSKKAAPRRKVGKKK